MIGYVDVRKIALALVLLAPLSCRGAPSWKPQPRSFESLRSGWSSLLGELGSPPLCAPEVGGRRYRLLETTRDDALCLVSIVYGGSHDAIAVGSKIRGHDPAFNDLVIEHTSRVELDTKEAASFLSAVASSGFAGYRSDALYEDGTFVYFEELRGATCSHALWTSPDSVRVADLIKEMKNLVGLDASCDPLNGANEYGPGEIQGAPGPG